ncbi:hypothetical protein F5883DRAFT_500119 [Diaporthe sp. PMI_573]|nr:hypothetical protein F5883DRAFT_500119 [Diaporthaceae sp. PMI_573]
MSDSTTTGQPPANLPTDSRGPAIIIIVAVLLPLAILFVGLRFYSRKRHQNDVGIDDWVILLALVFMSVFGGLAGALTSANLGRHIWTLSDAQIFYVVPPIYNLTISTIKISILLQYRRIFAVKMQRITTVIVVAVVLWTIVTMLLGFLACLPVAAYWDPAAYPDRHCNPLLPGWYANSAVNIATDIVIFTLPIPVLWKLQMPKSQRVSLIAIFGFGLFICSISVIRVTVLSQGDDTTYNNVDTMGWSFGEQCAGIICACLPTLRWILWRTVPERLRDTRSSQRRSHRYGDNAYGGASKASRSRATNKTMTASTARVASRAWLATSTDELRGPEEFEMVSTPGDEPIAAVRTLSVRSSHNSVGSIESKSAQEYGTAEKKSEKGPAVSSPNSPALPLGILTSIEPSQNAGNKSAVSRGGAGNHGIQVTREFTQQMGPWMSPPFMLPTALRKS